MTNAFSITPDAPVPHNTRPRDAGAVTMNVAAPARRVPPSATAIVSSTVSCLGMGLLIGHVIGFALFALVFAGSAISPG